MKITFYDANPGTRLMDKFLKLTWMVGCWLQKLFGAVDAYKGVTSYAELEGHLAALKTPVTHLQYWGHGSPGTVWISGKPTRDITWSSLRFALTPESVVWFRCCSVFRGAAGYSFSGELSDSLRCTVAGHTRVIGVLQGGLHTRKPNQPPSWTLEEGELKPAWLASLGLLPGNNTVTCLATKVPAGW